MFEKRQTSEQDSSNFSPKELQRAQRRVGIKNRESNNKNLNISYNHTNDSTLEKQTPIVPKHKSLKLD